jgi:hypothetical protein
MNCPEHRNSLMESTPPIELEAALLAEFDRVKRRRQARRIWRAAGSIAASVIAGWFLLHRQTPPPVNADAPPFIAIPYTEPLSPYERASVVRMELPVAAVIATGFRVQTPDPGGRVNADVLVGQDGRAHAIRFLSISTSDPNRRTNP